MDLQKKKKRSPPPPFLTVKSIQQVIQKEMVYFSMIKGMSAEGNTLLLQFTFLLLPCSHYSLGFIAIEEGIAPNPEQISY